MYRVRAERYQRIRSQRMSMGSMNRTGSQPQLNLGDMKDSRITESYTTPDTRKTQILSCPRGKKKKHIPSRADVNLTDIRNE